MRFIKWLILSVGIAIAGVALWWLLSNDAEEQVKNWISPKISIASASITNIDDKQIEVTSEVVLENSFPVEIKTDRIDYEIYIDSIKVVQDVYDEPVTIQSSDSTIIELSIEILSDSMANVIEYFEEHNIDSALYSVETNFQTDIPIVGEEEVTLNVEKRLPSIRLPEIELAEIDPNIFSDDEGLGLVVRIINPNHYPLQVQNGSFYFVIEDNIKVSGEMEDIEISAGGSQEVSIHVEKESGSIAKTGWDYLFNKSDTKFSYYFNGLLNSENKMLDSTEINMKVDGTLEELNEVVNK